MVAYFDRVNLSVALADKDGFLSFFQLTNSDRGLLNSAFFWSYALLQIPAGWIVDRYGVKWTYAAGFLLWSLTSAATAWVGTFQTLFMLRILLGVGESVVTPAAMRWIRFNFDERRRGTAVGILMAAAKVGPALGSFIAVKLLSSVGWQMMFLTIGLGSMLWLLPWLFLMTNDDRAREKEAKQTAGGKDISFGTVMASPVIWGTIVGTFCYQYFVYFALTWMPAYFKESFKMSLNDSGVFTAASFLCMAVVATLAGFAADAMIGKGYDAVAVRRGFTIAGFLTAGAGLVAALNTPPEIARRSRPHHRQLLGPHPNPHPRRSRRSHRRRTKLCRQCAWNRRANPHRMADPDHWRLPGRNHRRAHIPGARSYDVSHRHPAQIRAPGLIPYFAAGK